MRLYNYQIILFRVMDFLKRIGTERHKYKLQFFLKKVVINKNLPGKVYISVRRGDHKANTEKMVPIEDKICHFGNQVLTFPALTLFYDEDEKQYQEKKGEMKVILKTDNDEKKLLGIASFDVATYANEQKTRTFKQKIELQEMPKGYRGYISFQVYIQFVGEGSQTSKTKEDKGSMKDLSPYGKFMGKFQSTPAYDKRQNGSVSGAQDNLRRSKHSDRPPRLKKRTQSEDQDELFSSKRDKGQASKVSSRSRKRDQYSEINKQESTVFREEQKNRKVKSRRGSRSQDEEELFGYGRQKEQQPRSNHKKTHKKTAEQEGSSGVTAQANQLFDHKAFDKPKIKKKTRKQSQDEGSDGVIDKAENIFERAASKGKKVDQFYQDENYDKKGPKRSKNIANQSNKDTKSEKGVKKQTKEPNIFESQPTDMQESQPFFFDDPKTYPEQYQHLPKAQTDLQQQKIIPFQTKNNESETRKEASSQKSYGTPKRNKKVKENTLAINSKESKQSRQRIYSDNIENADANFNKNKVTVSNRGKEVNSSKEVEPSLESSQQSDVQSYFKQPAEKPKQRQPQVPPISPEALNFQRLKEPQQKSVPQRVVEEKDNEIKKLSSQLKSKNIEIKELKDRFKQAEKLKQQLADYDLRLQEDKIRQKQLREQSNNLEKQVARLKAENQDLKRQMNKTESFFRQTEERYQKNTDELDLQQQIKKLEKQKNQYLLALQKEKDKNKKQSKNYSQEVEKEKLKYKEYEDMSKAELKKLKDDLLSKLNNIQILKEKLKEKSGEQETLLRQNNTLNSNNIELEKKLGLLKIKICEKLNEAYENGENQMMNVLTSLNEGL